MRSSAGRQYHPLSMFQAWVVFDGEPKTGKSYTRSGTTVTVTFNAHGYAAGDIIEVASATDAALNGLQTITGVTTNTFTFTDADAAGANGTLTINVRTMQVFNVSGVTRTTAGNYVVTMSRALRLGYAVLATCTQWPSTTNNTSVGMETTFTKTTTQFRLHVQLGAGSDDDANYVSAGVLGNRA